MFKIEVLDIRIDTLMIRFYMMMAIIIVAGFLNIWALALVGLPVFLSALLGLRVNLKNFKIKSGNKSASPKMEKRSA